jgi:hypothetical protein
MPRDRAGADRGCPRCDQLVAQTLVRTFFVIMKHERADRGSEVRFAERHRSKHSDLTDSTKPSAHAFKLGLHAGRTRGVVCRNSTVLFPRTFCTLSREFSSLRRVEAAIGQRP